MKKTPTKSHPITVIAIITAKPGKVAALKRAVSALVAPTRKEPGCLNYDLHQNLEDPAAFVFHENWTSKAHLDAHLASAHLNAFRAKADALLAEPPRIILAAKVA